MATQHNLAGTSGHVLDGRWQVDALIGAITPPGHSCIWYKSHKFQILIDGFW